MNFSVLWDNDGVLVDTEGLGRRFFRRMESVGQHLRGAP